jgi:geranylgeranyl reductase
MYDVLVVGGGPCGASAAEDLAKAGYSVALLDRPGRIKPCGGAIPPILIREFDIPDHLLKAKIVTARMVSPTKRSVDIPIENGFVGMVDREEFDEFLRDRAQDQGVTLYRGTFEKVDRTSGNPVIEYFSHDTKQQEQISAKLIIGADGARSKVAKSEVPGAEKIPYVIAYHEIINAPESGANYQGHRCDVIYDGAVSPDFYGWVFPHGKTVSVGMGTGVSGFDLKKATADLRKASGLNECETIRKEGAPIPLKPLKKWDNDKDVVLAGDAAGVVAPSSGEGIYYAMCSGRQAAHAVAETLRTRNPKHLRLARKHFVKQHGTVFRVLEAMQNAYYKTDSRRERFVSLCHDVDVQTMTFDAYMNKKLGKARPLAHLKISFKNLMHLTGLVSEEFT